MIDIQGRKLTIRMRYDPAIHPIIKALPGAKWNPESKTWTIPIASCVYLQPLLDAGVPMSDAARDAAKPWMRNDVVSPEQFTETLPDGRTPMHHQQTAAAQIAAHKYKILADDMGLGKTLTALLAARAIGHPVHVLCPPSLRDNWIREAAGAGMTIQVHSWGKVPRTLPSPYTLIADEAHYAQSGKKSQRGANFLAIADDADAVICATGTPMRNGRPSNIWPLLRAVRCPIASNRAWFERRYCDAKPTRFTQWDATGSSNEAELHERMAPYTIRRTKADCLDLPPKTRIPRPVEQTAEAASIYAATFSRLMQEHEARIAQGLILGDAHAFVAFSAARHAASIAKVTAACELVDEILEQGGSVVVFTEFRASAGTIAGQYAATSCLLTGDTPTDERIRLVDDFQSGRRRVFVSTIRAGGVGITLTKAETVILLDRPLTPGDTEQAEDRLHRIGQRSAVTAVWLQWGDVDKVNDARLDAKTDVIEVVVNGRKRKIRRDISDKDLAEIIGF